MSDDAKTATGAVRSADADHLDFCSMPIIGVIAVARTSYEGGQKYGRYNYMKGFSAHNLLNHALRHQNLFLLGDRSEPHLEHAAWGLLAAIQSLTLNPELSAPHLLGPGATIPPAMESLLNREAPEKAEKRKSGFFGRLADWATNLVPEVMLITKARNDQRLAEASDPTLYEEDAVQWTDSGDEYLYACERAGCPVVPASITDELELRNASAERSPVAQGIQDEFKQTEEDRGRVDEAIRKSKLAREANRPAPRTVGEVLISKWKEDDHK
jgi:hypothetical protein